MNNSARTPSQTWRGSVIKAFVLGVVVFLVAFLVSGHVQAKNMGNLAEDVTATLKQQCASYDKLVVADRTKSLFRLTDTMKELSTRFAEDPGIVDDKYLEKCVDGLRISGISLLDEDLKLEASGYTRPFREKDWEKSSLAKSILDIVSHPSKIFAERIEQDGNYYDVCAVARKDAPGIVVGYYRQPTGLVADMKGDLESLLTGLQLERGGNYAIVEGDEVRAASDVALKGATSASNEKLSMLLSVEKDRQLHFVNTAQPALWGYHSEFDGYDLCVYYPVSALVTSALSASGVVTALYLVLCFALFGVRGKAMYRNQEELEAANRDLTETVEMLKSLETIFFALFRVDLRNGSYETIYLAPWLEGKIGHTGEYAKLRKLFIDAMVMPEYQGLLESKMSDKAIRESLSQDKLNDVRRSFYIDYRAIRGDERRWCRVTVTVVDYDEEGFPSHVLVLLQDVDKEKAKEAAYQTRILEEAHQARVANNAKSEFLRRISHDIRTPINGIKGYIDMSDRHPEDIELRRRCRSNVMTSLDTLMSLVNSVLDMSKLEGNAVSLENKQFKLTPLLGEIGMMLAPQAQARGMRCELDVQEDPDDVSLVGSPRHITQIFMNLMNNAIKYGKDGGYVRLTAKRTLLTDELAAYEFVCEDNGIGMSEEFQERLFEPFTQETNSARTIYEGSGLGLSIVKKLVEAMGGTIVCESKKGVGTTFAVNLSFGVEQKTTPSENEELSDEEALVGKRILLAEDNELNMDISAALLKDFGAEVSMAWNGLEAVKLFEKSPVGHFDLVLLDIMMPEMNGLEAARAIRALDRPDAKSVPMSAMSANAFLDDIEASLNAGMNAHIAKPVDAKELLSTAAGLLKRS